MGLREALARTLGRRAAGKASKMSQEVSQNMAMYH